MTGEHGEATLLQRMAWRLVPLLTIVYLIAYIDRANISYAKLTMVRSLGLTEAQFGFASSLFFIGYLIFEIPSNLALARFGARNWISRIMFTWGLATVLMAFTPGATIFLVLRFLLGCCEAGLYPGIIFYLSMWFPQSRRTGLVGILTLGSSLGNMFGSAIGGYSLELNGLLGLQGWQWVFLVTGVPAILMTAVVLALLPNDPASARFLDPAERGTIQAALDRDPPARKPAGGAPWTASSVLLVLLLGLGYGTISISIYGIAYWLPTLVKGFGVGSGTNGLLNMIPWGLTSLLLLWVPRRLTSFGRVLATAIAAAALGIVLFLLSIAPLSNTLRFAALSLGAPTLYLMLPCFWAVPPRLLPDAFLKGSAGAAAMAAIVCGSGIGGFAAQNLMPWVAQVTGSASAPMVVPACSLLLLGAGAAAIYLAVGVGPRDPRGLPAPAR